MGEKRKPSHTILLKNHGNGGAQRTHKIEIFPKALFDENDSNIYFRLRVDGKWFPPSKEHGRIYFRSYTIRDLIWKALHKSLSATK